MNDVHASRLAAALREQVADVEPADRLPVILDRARRRPAACYITLALTVALLLAAAALWQAQQQDEPPNPPAIHFQEA